MEPKLETFSFFFFLFRTPIKTSGRPTFLRRELMQIVFLNSKSGIAPFTKFAQGVIPGGESKEVLGHKEFFIERWSLWKKMKRF